MLCLFLFAEILNLFLVGNEDTLVCDTRATWLKIAENEGWLFWYGQDSYGKPSCSNHVNVLWDDIDLGGDLSCEYVLSS